MKEPQKKVLFYSLLAVCSAGVLLIWLPGFFGTVSDFRSGVGKQSESVGGFMSELQDIQREFDTSFKESGLQDTLTPTIDDKTIEEISAQLDQKSSLIREEQDRIAAEAKRNPDKAFCTRQGGYYQEEKEENGASWGVCAFDDGSACHALLFTRGKCHEGQYKNVRDSVPTWPDLTVSVERIDYCRRENGVLKMVDRNEARGMCLYGVMVKNSGRAEAATTQLAIDEKRYRIPPLKPSTAYTIEGDIVIQKVIDISALTIKVDTTDLLQEIDKLNNTYSYQEDIRVNE